MSTYTAVFEIPGSCTDSLEHLKRQALHRLTDMIPTHVTITGEWTFTPRTHRGKRFWLIAQAPATGATDPTVSRALADLIREDIPDMAAWIDTTTNPRSAAA